MRKLNEPEPRELLNILTNQCAIENRPAKASFRSGNSRFNVEVIVTKMTIGFICQLKQLEYMTCLDKHLLITETTFEKALETMIKLRARPQAENFPDTIRTSTGRKKRPRRKKALELLYYI